MDWKNPQEKPPTINVRYWLWANGPAVGRLVKDSFNTCHWIDSNSMPIRGVTLYADIISPDEIA
jgi:hypothetical protein